ncbi:hypothetical protein ABW20_dc0104637 [Dactylellina cionopaga]|nr:hypothetical protein ABW20_dc0104637 [Dactylellina cionopaga]
MLPKFLKNSYQRYKADTQKFTTWLVITAASCGATINANVTNPDEEPSIPLRSYATLVDAIVKHGIVLPKPLEVVLERAISIRKRCAKIFQVSKPNEKISNARHWHFITVMEDALKRLTSFAATKETKQVGSSPTTKDDYSQISNRFAILALDDNYSSVIETTKQGKKKKTASAQLYSIEDEYGEDVTQSIFMAYCLFEDLNNIREFIKETWIEYRDGDIDAMTAAVTTNAAIILGRDMIEDGSSLINAADFPGSENLPRTIFMLTSMLHGGNPTKKRRPTDPFNLDNFELADWSLATTMVLIESFIPVIQPKAVPFYRKGNWGRVDPTIPYNDRSTEEKFDNNREAMYDVLGEFVFLVHADRELWLEDEVTKAMKNMVKSKRATMFHAFSAQVLLDVGDTLAAKKATPFNDLRMTILRAKKNLTGLLGFAAKVTCPTWPAENNLAVESLLKRVDFEFTVDRSIPVKKKASGSRFVHSEFHLFKENPILSGLIMYDLNLKLQELGTTVINGWGTVLPVLYLYDILEKTPSVPTVEWKDLDEFLRLHDEKSIFVGERPKDLPESFRKLQLSLGLSPTALASGSRVSNSIHSTQGPRPITATTVLSAVFSQALHSNRSNALSVTVVEKVLECLESEPEMTPALLKSPSQATALQILKKKWKNTKMLTPLQLLTTMRSHLAAEEPKLLFNYFGLHERCFQFLGNLRDHLHDKLVQYNGPNYLDEEYQLPFVVSYVMKAAIMSAKASQAMGIPSGNVGSAMMVRTANHMKEYTSKKGDVACKELRVFSKAYKTAPAGSQEKMEKELYWTAMEELVDPRSMALTQYGNLN